MTDLPYIVHVEGKTLEEMAREASNIMRFHSGYRMVSAFPDMEGKHKKYVGILSRIVSEKSCSSQGHRPSDVPAYPLPEEDLAEGTEPSTSRTHQAHQKLSPEEVRLYDQNTALHLLNVYKDRDTAAQEMGLDLSEFVQLLRKRPSSR